MKLDLGMAKAGIDIAANLAAVRERLTRATVRVGRSPEEITLVGVSKTKPVSAIHAAMQAGLRDLGENRPEDAWDKLVDPSSSQSLANLLLRHGSLPGASYRLHLIGPIQSRKAALAVACRPQLIHAVDRYRIARRLDHYAAEASLILEVLLEVNVSGETSKFGFQPESVEDTVNDLLSLRNLRIRGLMTLPPYDPDPEMARPYFVRLRKLRDRLAHRWPEVEWHHLSMGMSHDFEVAIEEGATIVRVGTAIFGERA